MKRIGFIYDKIYEIDNIKLALHNASRGKTKKRSVKKILDNEEYYVNEIQKMLKDKTFKPSKYFESIIVDGLTKKQRVIHKPKFYPDQIIHWALILKIKDLLMRGMYKWSCASIPKRGAHYAKDRTQKWLREDVKGTKWCLKLDIKKYYPNINKELLKIKFTKIIKCCDTLNLINLIIDSHDKGLPIGNYTSQWFANFNLQDVDHYVKETLKVPYYIRYMDDLVLLHRNKKELRKAFILLSGVLHDMGLEVKSNYQLFNIDKRSLDFAGFVMNHRKTFIRKRITKRARRKALRFPQNMTIQSAHSLMSYYGWYLHSDSHLLKLKYYKDIIKNIKELIANESRIKLNNVYSGTTRSVNN